MVADARTRAGMSQRELAQRAGTSQSAIARIESGTVSPSFATARRLLAACGFELRLSLAPAGATDPVIEAYKRDVDRTLLRENLLIYGLGGLVVPFIGIKLIDLFLVAFGLA